MNRKFNNIIWLLLILIVFFTATTQTIGSIIIISQEYAASGWVDTKSEMGPGPSDSFSYSSESGVSGSAEAEIEWYAYVDAFSTSNIIYDISETCLKINPHVCAMGCSDLHGERWAESWGYTDANATVIFQTTGTSFPATFMYRNMDSETPSSWQFELSLTDLTDEIQIYQKSLSGNYYFDFEETEEWEVNPSHLYCLEVSASVNVYACADYLGCTDESNLKLSVILPAVPEPGTFLLLGLGGVFLRRRPKWGRRAVDYYARVM